MSQNTNTTDNKKSPIYRLSSNVGGMLLIYTIARIMAMVGKEIATSQFNAADSRSTIIISEYAGYMLGLIMITLFMKESVPLKKVFAGGEKVTPMILGLLLIARIGMLFPAELINDGIKKLTEILGSSLQQTAAQAEGRNHALVLSELLFAGIIGPVVEEIVYRGFVMRRLEPHGKAFAIVTSAILFGLMHGNPIQLISAGLGGLVLGYAAMRYGILWSILLHIFNNLVLVDLLQNGLGQFTGEAAMEIITTSLTLVCFVLAIILISKRRDSLKEYLSSGETAPKSSYFRIYLSVTMIIFILFNIISMAGSFK